MSETLRNEYLEWLKEEYHSGLEKFKDVYAPEIKTIYYPGSSVHTLEEVFPKSRVIYLDISQEDMDYLKQQGHEAIHHSAFIYEPEEVVDLLLILNTALDVRRASRAVGIGGFVIANSRVSYPMHSHPDFVLLSQIENRGQIATEINPLGANPQNSTINPGGIPFSADSLEFFQRFQNTNPSLQEIKDEDEVAAYASEAGRLQLENIDIDVSEVDLNNLFSD